MTTTAVSASINLDAVSRLSMVLQEEQGHYMTLLDLAQTQGVLMTTHDFEGLDANALRITEELASADSVRIQREIMASEVLHSAGASVDESLSSWLESQSDEIRQHLDTPVRNVRRIAGELARANEMNRRLANFCLDLVEEEAAILRRCLLEDPAGCYDNGANPASNDHAGVITRKA